ncbi:MAG: MarR family winged helix-turn-helix transcriptional regulator [Acidimicrobiales bacterium]
MAARREEPGGAPALLTLMGRAQRSYVTSIRAELEEAGCGDMPSSGYRVVGSVARGVSTLGDLAAVWRISKQAASRLVESLVGRGYLRRVPDEADRRHSQLVLTERGRTAAVAIGEAVGRVDTRLADQVGAGDVAVTRATLRAIAEMTAAPGDGPTPVHAPRRRS